MEKNGIISGQLEQWISLFCIAYSNELYCNYSSRLAIECVDIFKAGNLVESAKKTMQEPVVPVAGSPTKERTRYRIGWWIWRVLTNFITILWPTSLLWSRNQYRSRPFLPARPRDDLAKRRWEAKKEQVLNMRERTKKINGAIIYLGVARTDEKNRSDEERVRAF